VAHESDRTRREHLNDEAGEVTELVTDAYYRGWLDCRDAARAALGGGSKMPGASQATRAFLDERMPGIRIGGQAYDIAAGETDPEPKVARRHPTSGALVCAGCGRGLHRGACSTDGS
jgi:hypothetical protein